ncbi:MAG: ATP-binding protein [Peptostreptococcaceae bacterium]|nr:ATP-binding protein [Peptostreptococcaceae bacterium]
MTTAKNQGRKVGVETVYSYINALEEAMILLTARRYDIKGKKVLERNEKYFFADLGIRYAMLGYSSNDISQMLENVIYMELLRRVMRNFIYKSPICWHLKKL